jgi:phage gp37-like protein
MMRDGNNTHVPAKAALVNRAEVTLAGGRVVKVELYSGEASDGYQTSYRARPAAWLAWIRLEGGRVTYRYVKQYTGRNHDQAWTDYRATAAEVEREAAKQAAGQQAAAAQQDG